MKPGRIVEYDVSDSSSSDNEEEEKSDRRIFINVNKVKSEVVNVEDSLAVEKFNVNDDPEEAEDIERIVFNVLQCLVSRVSKFSGEEPAAASFQKPKRQQSYSFDRKDFRDVANVRRNSDDCSDSDYSASSDDDNESALCCHSDVASSAYDTDDSDYVYNRIVTDSRRIKQKPVKKRLVLITKGELSFKDLPPIENLNISLNETIALKKFGAVTSVVDTLVIILSDRDVPPLDQDTSLFTEDRSFFGKVFETFGPVLRPYYSVRFNDVATLKATNVRMSTSIFFVPDSTEHTRKIFADALRQIKGSDASWKDNNEPPIEALDFSDDEEERRFKARRREKTNSDAADHKNSTADGATAADQSSFGEHAPAPKRRMQQQHQRHRRRTNRSGGGSNGAAPGGGGGYVEVVSAQTSGQHMNSAVAFSPNVQSISRFRNPWISSPNAMRHSPPVVYHNQLPSPSAASSNNDWMWMSEQAFRFPPPRPPPGFGRGARMMQPAQTFPITTMYPPPPPPPYNNSNNSASPQYQQQFTMFPFTSRPPPPPPPLLPNPQQQQQQPHQQSQANVHANSLWFVP